MIALLTVGFGSLVLSSIEPIIENEFLYIEIAFISLLSIVFLIPLSSYLSSEKT
jgi:hypothetical protein